MNLKLLTLSTKKQDVNDKTNYQPISLLPIISKMFAMVLYSQLENIFTKTVWTQKRAFFTKCSFKLIKELAKIFRYIWSSKDRIN